MVQWWLAFFQAWLVYPKIQVHALRSDVILACIVIERNSIPLGSFNANRRDNLIAIDLMITGLTHLPVCQLMLNPLAWPMFRELKYRCIVRESYPSYVKAEPLMTPYMSAMRGEFSSGPSYRWRWSLMRHSSDPRIVMSWTTIWTRWSKKGKKKRKEDNFNHLGRIVNHFSFSK